MVKRLEVVKMPDKKDEKEIDRSGIQFTSDANTSIDSSALGAVEEGSDEASLVEALQQNAFVLALTRFFIKIKNHVSIIPMVMTIVCTIIITCTIHTHLVAINALGRNDLNSILFFCNNVLSIVSCLLYINVNNKKTETKKKIIFTVLFFIVVGLELFINFRYMRDINIELSLVNSKNKVTDDGSITKSYAYTNLHNIFLFIDIALVILAPIVQPFAKKIQIHKRKKTN